MDVRVASVTDLSICLEIRREVFIEEQHVPRAEEIDGLDWECVHFLAADQGAPVGTARLRRLEPGLMKVERVAVRRSHRRRGVGAAIMNAVETEAFRLGANDLVLAAQVGALSFYTRLGWVAEGPVFDDAGIPHRKMHKRIG